MAKRWNSGLRFYLRNVRALLAASPKMILAPLFLLTMCVLLLSILPAILGIPLSMASWWVDHQQERYGDVPRVLQWLSRPFGMVGGKLLWPHAVLSRMLPFVRD